MNTPAIGHKIIPLYAEVDGIKFPAGTLEIPIFVTIEDDTKFDVDNPEQHITYNTGRHYLAPLGPDNAGHPDFKNAIETIRCNLEDRLNTPRKGAPDEA